MSRRFLEDSKEALRLGLLPEQYLRLKQQILQQAIEFLERDYVSYAGSEAYWVCYKVEKTNDVWTCNCKDYKRLGFCAHSLAVKIKEQEGEG